jgi:PAS domain S-box-containing protein
MRSDFASMQLLHLERGELRLLTHRGFSPEAAHQWEWVRASSACACGVALATGERVIVPDVESCVFMAGTEQLATYRQTGIRAVQTTPLLSRSGKLLGMISTHWGRPHEPSERDLRLFDILARQAADLIERKRADEELRESEGRFRMLANSAPVLMWLNDASGCVFVNRAYLQFLGVSDEGAVQGNEWSGYVHPDDRQGYLGAWLDALSKRAPFSAEFRFRRHDGVYRWMQSVGMPRYTAFGEFLGFHGCTYDVHEARVAAELLREADRHKDEFLAMLAHELRNPLAPIQSALGAILLKGADPAEVRSEAAMMQRHVAQLRRLVDDLLDMSRISRGRIELHKKSVDLGAIAREAAEAVRPLANRTELNLCVSVPGERLWVDGDATRLTQVMANLLQNACKFTPSGGQIELVVERAHEQALVRVRDSGIGIAAENLRNIFEMFSQVDTSLERSREGLGLGLTLVRVLIELHGGTVVARSDGVGRGSEFIVTLPLVTAPATELPAKTTGDMESPAPSRRILIVDDNRDAASSLAKLLYICGHSTLTAFDGEEALAAAEEFRPDVFLLDIGLPKLNGYDLCTRIRQMPWAAGAIIVALTGWGQESDRQRSKQAGFDLHLVKPVDLDVLERLLGQPEDGTTETPHVASQAT